MSETVTATLAGSSLELETGGAGFLRNDSMWRLSAVHARFLATQSLPQRGRAIDIGAGFGVFALPFARRYPGWEVWCFEPDAAAFVALERNIRTHGLTNVRAFALAVRGGADLRAMPPILTALQAGDGAALVGACPSMPFRRHEHLDGFLDASGTIEAGTAMVDLPTLPAEALTALAPDLVKLVAPCAEQGILEAMEPAMPTWLVGESWQTLSSRHLGGATRAAWVPFAKSPQLALRRSGQARTLGDSLDIVVDAADARAESIAAAVGHLTQSEEADVRILLVVSSQETMPDNPRVSVLRPPHAGWATAHDLGRRHSTAGHIAFLDLRDRPEPGLFSRLLDLARLSDAEVVEGGSKRGPGWAGLPRDGAFRLGGQEGGFLPASRLMADHPPSRARIYRRDFLDARRIWLPEHLGAFAGHYLHFLTLQHAGAVPVLPGAIFQEHRDFALLDESAFFLLEVCRLVLKRGIEEGWRAFAPLLDGFGLALREACQGIRPELQPDFLEGMAELLVMMEKALGPFMPRPADHVLPEIPRLTEAVQRLRQQLRSGSDGYAWAWLDGPRLQAPMMVQQKLWRAQTEAGQP